LLTCGMASLESDGHVSGFLTDESDILELLDKVNSTQIDGVNFQAELRGKDVTLLLDGEGVSRKVHPNSCNPGMPLSQVSAAVAGKTEAAKQSKKTASVLNKLIYRMAKKSGRTLFVKSVGARKSLPASFELLELEGCIDEGLLSRIMDANTVTILIQTQWQLSQRPHPRRRADARRTEKILLSGLCPWLQASRRVAAALGPACDERRF